jgi:hypothetical protein
MNSSRRVAALTLALGVLSLLPLEAQDRAPVRIAGPWEGAIQVGAASLRMRVVFSEAPGELRAVIDIPQQGASGLPLSAVVRADSNVHFELPTPTARAIFDGRITGNTISGTFAQGQVAGTFELTRIAPAETAPRLPYVEHEIAVTNGPIRLAGTLTVPSGKGAFPLVVMITGSGPKRFSASGSFRRSPTASPGKALPHTGTMTAASADRPAASPPRRRPSLPATRLPHWRR